MSDLADKIDERAKAWREPIQELSSADQCLTPNYAIAMALEEVARAIRSADKKGQGRGS